MQKIVISVTDSGHLKGRCKCGWTGLAFSQKSGLAPAMKAVEDEMAEHKCPPKEKRPRKRKVKANV